VHGRTEALWLISAPIRITGEPPDPKTHQGEMHRRGRACGTEEIDGGASVKLTEVRASAVTTMPANRKTATSTRDAFSAPVLSGRCRMPRCLSSQLASTALST
jgi:hypothetical protein